MSQREPKLVQDARGLSSGTLSYLIGSTKYAVVDQVQADFIEFCQECPNYTDWMAAWSDFKTVYDIAYVIAEKGL